MSKVDEIFHPFAPSGQCIIIFSSHWGISFEIPRCDESKKLLIEVKAIKALGQLRDQIDKTIEEIKKCRYNLNLK